MLSQKLLYLQRAHQKDYSRIIEEARSRRVMVPLKLDYVFVAAVFLKHLLGMVRQYECVLLAVGEKRWDETFRQVVDRLQIVNIEIGTGLHRAANKAHRS